MSDVQQNETAVSFPSASGRPLGGTLITGEGSGPCVLISGATAVPHRYYANFARWLVEQGAGAVLTYDYSGIGTSTEANTMKTVAYRTWMFEDFPAAVDELERVADGRPIVGMGHSFGGHALGLNGTAHRFTRYCTMGTLSGYWRHVGTPVSVWLQAQIALPLVAHLFGGIPKALSPGEALPKGVALDWARWMRMPDYFFSDTGLPETAGFKDVRIPILSIGATDDDWGSPRAVETFMRHYENADLHQVWLEPGESGPVGHLGMFRKAHRHTHWPVMGDYFAGWFCRTGRSRSRPAVRIAWPQLQNRRIAGGARRGGFSARGDIAPR